jgi:hypothetical protein
MKLLSKLYHSLFGPKTRLNLPEGYWIETDGKHWRWASNSWTSISQYNSRQQAVKDLLKKSKIEPVWRREE